MLVTHSPVSTSIIKTHCNEHMFDAYPICPFPIGFQPKTKNCSVSAVAEGTKHIFLFSRLKVVSFEDRHKCSALDIETTHSTVS